MKYWYATYRGDLAPATTGYLVKHWQALERPQDPDMKWQADDVVMKAIYLMVGPRDLMWSSWGPTLFTDAGRENMDILLEVEASVVKFIKKGDIEWHALEVAI